MNLKPQVLSAAFLAYPLGCLTELIRTSKSELLISSPELTFPHLTHSPHSKTVSTMIRARNLGIIPANPLFLPAYMQSALSPTPDHISSPSPSLPPACHHPATSHHLSPEPPQALLFASSLVHSSPCLKELLLKLQSYYVSPLLKIIR